MGTDPGGLPGRDRRNDPTAGAGSERAVFCTDNCRTSGDAGRNLPELMANETPKMKPMFLPGVEANPQPGPYADSIRMLQAGGAEYPQIWHMFAYLPKA